MWSTQVARTTPGSVTAWGSPREGTECWTGHLGHRGTGAPGGLGSLDSSPGRCVCRPASSAICLSGSPSSQVPHPVLLKAEFFL